MDYSKTLNLPSTDFPMKANLTEREPVMLKTWENEDIYSKIQKERKNGEIFILHDGPPYANGHIHAGTAMNKILKDIIVKHKTMMGFRVPYVPGWDCHGLPIELNVIKELEEKSKHASVVEIRKKCRSYAEKFIKIQMEEFKRLGVFGDFKNPYLTMSPAYEAKILEIFGLIYREGFIYRSKKPIYWCPTCETALAEAEVEYGDHTSPSIYVKFRVDPATVDVKGIDKDNVFIVIWTTTPWTLPANLAVAFHPEYSYSAFKFGSEYHIVADGLIWAMEDITGIKKEDSIPLSIDQIKKMKTRHPFIDRESKVIFGTHVTLEQGTGIVHTAPGHGYEDFVIGKEFGLPPFSPVDGKGRFTDEFPDMKGVNVFDANPKVVELLKNKNSLIYTDDITHSYPHCWRCKKALIFRATEQWFMSIDHRDMRKLAQDITETTQWVPSWGKLRSKGMVDTRPDWCLSRQRSWGVPIPSFTCKKCGRNMMNAETILHFSELSLKKGIDVWYTEDIKDLVPKGTVCECGGAEFEKEFDILDVWFDSGISHFAVCEVWPGHRWPSDVYLEGSDQHRGWFQSSLWPALALRKKAPYNTVITHGFMLDERGIAMSKSAGNVIHPLDLIKKFGADVLRLWVSSEDYRNDVKIGFDMMNQVSDSYRRIRNTFRFLMGNLSDFNEKHAVSYDQMPDTDKWILHRLYHLSKRVIEAYEKYEFHIVYRSLLNFCAVELSSIYFDVSKDILYIEQKNSIIRRANQTALKEILETLVRLAAPILIFTSEEIWKFTGQTSSVHSLKYHNLDERYNNPEIEKRMDAIVDIKKEALKALDIKRREKVIGSSLEADITVFAKDESPKNWLQETGEEARRFFQVANVFISPEKQPGMEDYDNSSIKVEKTTGKKCVRCWNYTGSLGEKNEHPELCQRCTKIIENI